MNKIATLSVLGALALGAGIALMPSAPFADAAQPQVALGKTVAPFSLPAPGGKTVSVGDWNKSKASVIWFISTQCPVSNAYNERMETLAKTYTPRGVKFYGVNANNAEDLSAIAEHSREHGFTFPILKDQGNAIADRFNARVTPEVYVVAPDGKLVYHGQIDNSQNEKKVVNHPLAVALNEVLAGQPVKASETTAFGCSIKREN